MKTENKGFTLIEMLIVIVIIMIITIWVIWPYNFYSNVAKVKISKEILTQSLNTAKNTSAWIIGWYDKKNQNIWINIIKWKDYIELLSFPFDQSWSITRMKATDIKTIKLENNVNISMIKTKDWTEYNETILYYKSPEWDMESYISPTHTWIIDNITIWLKGAKEWILSKVIQIK